APRSSSLRAFTLLEIILAVAILALIVFSIFRFVEVNLFAIRISTEKAADDMAMQALFSTLRWQLMNLPAARTGSLLGDAHKFNDKESDEIRWFCTAGNGLFTQFADTEYNVTLTLRPVPKTTTSELGLRRLVSDGSDKDPHWLP